MKYFVKHEVTKDHLNFSFSPEDRIKFDEYIRSILKEELMRKLIEDLDIKISKLEFSTKEIDKAIKKNDKFLIEKLKHLRDYNIIEYTAEVEI